MNDSCISPAFIYLLSTLQFIARIEKLLQPFLICYLPPPIYQLHAKVGRYVVANLKLVVRPI
jgi:hypothetical protein